MRIMNTYIYCRVMPNNRSVAYSDRLEAQEKRCREITELLRLPIVGVYVDEGNIDPTRLPRGITKLLAHLTLHRQRFSCVVCDHPARLGVEPEIREQIINKIERLGAIILPVSGTLTEFDKE